jgi:ABC-2 type transport system permease protein
MQRIIAQIEKELRQIFRDRTVLILAFVLPLSTLVIIGKSVSLKVNNIPIVIQDLDQSALSRKYLDQFRQSLIFNVETWPVNERPERALDSNLARAAIIIPGGFERDLRSGRNIQIQVLVDASDANTANILRGYSRRITKEFLSSFQDYIGNRLISSRMRVWYNPGLKAELFTGPGVLGVVLALFPPLFAALSMSREYEQKTILQVYASDLSAVEFLLGKTLAFFLIALAEWSLALPLSLYLFKLGFAGNPAPMLIGTLFFLLSSVSFGTLIGLLIQNQAAAIQAVQIGGFVLSFLMSGFIFPLSNIPDWIRWISFFVPTRYYIELTRDSFVRGGGWQAVWHAPLLLALLALLFLLIAWLKIRRMRV